MERRGAEVTKKKKKIRGVYVKRGERGWRKGR